MARRLTVGQASPAVSAAQLTAATTWTALGLPAPGPVHADVTTLLAVTALGALTTGVTF